MIFFYVFGGSGDGGGGGRGGGVLDFQKEVCNSRGSLDVGPTFFKLRNHDSWCYKISIFEY